MALALTREASNISYRLLDQVRLRIGNQRLTAVITRDAVEELKLKRDQPALAIMKSREVMIGREGDEFSGGGRYRF